MGVVHAVTREVGRVGNQAVGVVRNIGEATGVVRRHRRGRVMHQQVHTTSGHTVAAQVTLPYKYVEVLPDDGIGGSSASACPVHTDADMRNSLDDFEFEEIDGSGNRRTSVLPLQFCSKCGHAFVKK